MAHSNETDTNLDFDIHLLWQRLDSIIDGFIKLLPAILIGAVVFFLFIFASVITRKLIRKAISSKDKANLGMVLGRLAQWGVMLLGLLVSMTIIMPSVTPGKLIGALGIGGVAIGFAFKDILQNFLAGILLLLREPFRIGDQIIYGNFEGTVTEIETRSTTIKTYSGQKVIIPNGEIYTSAITVNTAYPQIRSEYDIGIGYSDDIDLAKDTILAAISGKKGVLADPSADVLVIDLADSYVLLRARWWTSPTRSETVRIKSNIIHAIKIALDDAGIDMPYPTQVMLWHDQTEETDGDRNHQREGWPAGKNPPKAKFKPSKTTIVD